MTIPKKKAKRRTRKKWRPYVPLHAPETLSLRAKQDVRDIALANGVKSEDEFSRARNRPHHEFLFDRLRVWSKTFVVRAKLHMKERYAEVAAYASYDPTEGRLTVPAVFFKRPGEGYMVICSAEDFFKLCKLADATLKAIGDVKREAAARKAAVETRVE